MFELPDGSNLVMSENATLTIPVDFGPNATSRVTLMMVKVRFYIQRLGGRPNLNRTLDPTALIAVRG